jgi:hypothetical protein
VVAKGMSGVSALRGTRILSQRAIDAGVAQECLRLDDAGLFQGRRRVETKGACSAEFGVVAGEVFAAK